MIRNSTTEREIRDWLTGNGYYGRSARFQEVELHAIQRPGWLQIFRFSVTARNEDDEWHDLFGLLRDDERYRRLDVEIFPNESQRNELLQEWSKGLIVRRSRHERN